VARRRASPWKPGHPARVEVTGAGHDERQDKSRDYPAMGIPPYLILDPRDGTWTYQWGIDTSGGRPVYGNRLQRQPYGTPLAVTTELGTWKLDTSGLPLYSRKDMMLPPE